MANIIQLTYRTRNTLAVKAALTLSIAICAIGCSGPSAAVPNQNAAKVPATNFRESQVTFLAVGDMMLSRGVASAIDRKGDPLFPFSRMVDIFNSTDFNFGNLESPVSGNDRRIGRGLVFNARTADIAGLTKYNFTVVNLANNHAMDQGIEGLRFTKKILTEKKIENLGTGDNKDEAWTPKVVTAKGVRIGFVGVSYASVNDMGRTYNDYVARIEEVERLKAAIARSKSESDFVVVTMHAGDEYMRNPNRDQIDFARAAVDAGADIVIGAHPHWIQTFEKYKDKYIFYSLGNFIFDQRKPDTREGLTLKVTVIKDKPEGARLGKLELIPVIIDDYAVPRPASEAETQAIFRKIGANSKVLN